MGNFSVIAVSAVLLLTIIALLIGLTHRALRLGMRRMRYSSKAVKFTSYSTVIIMATWLVITGFFSFIEIIQRHWLPFVANTVGFIVPLVFMYLLYSSAKINKVVMKMTKQWFVNIHFFRVFIELMLWFMFFDGIIPKQLTFEGMNFDLVFGLSAPFIAYRCFKSKEWSMRVAIIWNVLGALSLVWVTLLSLLSTEGPFYIFTDAIPNRLAIQFPFIWLQTFFYTVFPVYAYPVA